MCVVQEGIRSLVDIINQGARKHILRSNTNIDKSISNIDWIHSHITAIKIKTPVSNMADFKGYPGGPPPYGPPGGKGKYVRGYRLFQY